MARRARGSKLSHRKRSAQGIPPGEPLIARLLKLLVGALLVARLLVPTEGAVFGDTLWMVVLWLAAGVLWGWSAWREGNFRLRWNRLDTWAWILVFGHVLSALAVCFSGGDKRAAINMLWEWIGLGVAFFLCRRVASSLVERRRVATIMIAATTAIASLGIYQHYVWYPQAAREYEAVRKELDQLLAAPPPATTSEAIDRQERVRKLQTDLSVQGVPSDGPSRILWENRLKASREPFGMFALANTLAGLLLAWSLVAAGMLSTRWRAGRRLLHVLGPALMLGVLAFCLLLTKSRTAVVGLAAAVAAWAVISFLRRSGRMLNRRWWLGVGAVVAVAAAAVGTAAATGSLDRAVLSEASKSFDYRLQFWTGAWKVVLENPVLGTGPGNFRQHYLRYKLPESSEEIADPHNFILDVWTSGGLLALVGLVGLIAAAWGRSLVASKSTESQATTNAPSAADVNHLRTSIFYGAILGFAAVLGTGWLFDGEADTRILVLAAAFLGFSAFLRPFGPPVPPNDLARAERQTTQESQAGMATRACLTAAAFGLLVHLLGAGGIEMPAIAQTLLLLVGMMDVTRESYDESNTPDPSLLGMAFSITMLALIVTCLVSAVIPVMNRKSFIRMGDAALIDRPQADTADRYYREAAQSDPLSPEPAMRLAEAAFRRWQSTEFARDTEFQQAAQFQRLAIELDPHNPAGYRQLGRRWFAKYERSRDQADAQSAVDWLTQATDRYPSESRLRAELAEALAGARNPGQASEEAAAALEFDAVNRARGHSDRYLPESQVQQLRKLRIGTPEPAIP